MSVAVTIVYVAELEVEMPSVGEITILEGQLRLGGALSTMVSGNEHVLTFPALSVAVQVTLVVVRTVNRVTPESGHTIDAIPLPSVAVTLDAKYTNGSGLMSVLCVVYE